MESIGKIEWVINKPLSTVNIMTKNIVGQWLHLLHLYFFIGVFLFNKKDMILFPIAINVFEREENDDPPGAILGQV